MNVEFISCHNVFFPCAFVLVNYHKTKHHRFYIFFLDASLYSDPLTIVLMEILHHT